MGVQGLATFIQTNQQIYRDVRFRKSRLVIDGCNLLYLLYFNSGLDQNHGGEYAAFKDRIEKFIAALRACGVSPYVLLDGGTDPTDKKLETISLRAADRVRKAHRAAVGGESENILPQLAKLVFRQTLARLEVPMAQCYAEADQEIAALANEWQCPVLSNDSDFYIFDLPGGLLPLTHFQWEAAEQGGSRSSIPCKKFNSSSFCTFFNIQPQLLPTFATLAGNDYVNLYRLETPIRWAEFSPAGSETPSRLGGLLCWLRGFQQPQEALEAALGLMGELSREKKAEVLKGLYLGMEEYRIPPSSLKNFFIHRTPPPFPLMEEEAAGLVPDWIRLPLTEGRLTSDVLDVLLLQRMSLSVSVDHADMPSAYLTSRPLRQVMYGLLLGRGRTVQETDRLGLELTTIEVQPAFRGVANQLLLSSLDRAEPAQRLQVLLEALGVTEASLSHLPPQLRLTVAVCCYWLKRAHPGWQLLKTLLKALLLGMSNGDTLRNRAALQVQKQQELDLDVAHAFSQWQACLKDSIYLNQLLGFPLAEPQIHMLYEGTLVHRLVHRLRTGKLKNLLKYNHTHVKHYKLMLAAVHQCAARQAAAPSDKAAAPQRQRRPPNDQTFNLQQLFQLCEGDEVSSAVRALEDASLEDLVSVRTRYTVKERNNRCNNPELTRKDQRRGHDLL